MSTVPFDMKTSCGRVNEVVVSSFPEPVIVTCVVPSRSLAAIARVLPATEMKPPPPSVLALASVSLPAPNFVTLPSPEIVPL